jgi:pimeloyl-ACP methyl ester carboxylesterase
VALVVVALLVAGGGVAALVALGPGSPAPDERGPAIAASTSPAPGATRAPRPALARFYAQRPDWSDCGDGAQCAALTVPLDYRRPAGRTLELALLRMPARDPAHRIGSLVVNPGGPGVPGTTYAAQAAQAFREPLRDRFDIVGFDPRGTGASAPVDCLSDAGLDAYVAGDPDPDSRAEQRAYVRSARAFGRGCAARSGTLAAHVSTVESARDVDVLRAALGEARLTWFGASYGTELGATYADLFPRRVGRMVLDGAVDPTLDTRRLVLDQARGFETALRSYVANCVATTDSCFLGDTVEEGMARIRGFLDRVDADPLPTGSGRSLEAGNAYYGISLALYNRDFWVYLSQALRSAFGGDGSTLLLLSDEYTGRAADGYRDNRIEAFLAISCLDDPEALTAAQVRRVIPRFEAVAPTFGRSSAWGLTGCLGFPPRSPASRPPELHASGAPPIVVIGTTRDPATPLRWAEHLADLLDSGVLVTRDGDGHTGYNSGNDCVDEAVEAYLVDGTVPRDHLSC